MILDKIKKPNDIHKIPLAEFPQLAEEIRSFLIESVSRTGGHLASNLGVVELTLALHNVLDFPDDKLIWDVGHQAYTHKILTGRKGEFETLRKEGGLSGFPKRGESNCDSFDAGHSSDSISAGLGYVYARDLLGENYHVVSVIGDGALTGGMAYEALNNAAELKTNFIIVLNDNNMSISPNVGGMSNYLSAIRTAEAYTGMKMSLNKAVKKIPRVGTAMVDAVRRTKSSIKQLFIPGMLFENMGLTYLGPVDGHNMRQMMRLFNEAKRVKGPVVVHVLTEKGRGYEPARQNPDMFHGIGPFDIKTGKPTQKKVCPGYTDVFADALCQVAAEEEKLVAITAAMPDGTGLKKFSQRFPDRFFDVGIAEEHAVSFAAGLALGGVVPVVAIYSSFLQRAVDQMLHDVCMQKLHVIFAVDRAGLVGADGETHQGTLDMAFFRLVPNLTIMAPKDFKELEDMLEFAVKLNKPVIIRYPRGGEDSKVKFERHENIELGKAEVLKKIIDEEKSNKTKILQKIGDKVFNNKTQRERVTIIAIGKMVARAMDIGQRLQEKMDVEVINARFLKPLDDNTIIESIKKTKNVITIEDGTIINGLATAVKEVIVNNNLQGVKIKSYAYPDEFIKHGSVDELEKIYGLDEENIINGVNKS